MHVHGINNPFLVVGDIAEALQTSGRGACGYHLSPPRIAVHIHAGIPDDFLCHSSNQNETRLPLALQEHRRESVARQSGYNLQMGSINKRYKGS